MNQRIEFPEKEEEQKELRLKKLDTKVAKRKQSLFEVCCKFEADGLKYTNNRQSRRGKQGKAVETQKQNGAKVVEGGFSCWMDGLRPIESRVAW